MNRSIITAGMLLAVLSGKVLPARSGAAGAGPTSAGVVERLIQREFNIQDLSPEKEVPILEVDIPKETLDIPEGISIYIKHIEVQKNYPLFDKEIQKITARYEGRELDGQDVVDICYEIEQVYARAGYILAWVYPPIQRVDNDTLKLSVLEGRIDDIVVSGNTSYTTRYIKRYFAQLQDEPVNYNDLMKALLLVNENVDLSVQGVLKKGKELGGVDLLLGVQDSRPLSLSAGYNNWGAASTTFNQLASTFVMGNLATSGDTLTMMTSCGAPFVFYYLNPVYSFPLTGSGARIDLSYLYSHSNTQGKAYEQWDLSSWAEIATITYTQPLVRTRRFEATVTTSFSYADYKNLSLGYTTSYDRLRIVNFGGTIDYTDSLKGRNIINGVVNVGIPDILGGSSVVDPQCSRIGGGGRYYALNLYVQRVQPVLTDYMLVLTGTGQGTFNKIPTSIQYYLGGMGTVRGYTSGIALGDSGYCVNAEFYIPPPFFKDRKFKPMNRTWGDILQLLAFVDHGGVYTVDAVVDEISPAYLTSVGGGFRFYGPHNLSLSFDAGFPVMHQYKQCNNIFYVRLNMDFL